MKTDIATPNSPAGAGSSPSSLFAFFAGLKLRMWVWADDWRIKLHLRFMLKLNRMLGTHGQNAYCTKSDVKMLVAEVAYRWRDNPTARARFQELLDAIEDLKV